MSVRVQHANTRTGPTFANQPPNILIRDLTDAHISKISRCLKSEQWIKVGRELEIPHADLEQIKANHKDWDECAYQMLILWKERRPNSLLQDLFTALDELEMKQAIMDIAKQLERNPICKPNESENTATENMDWSESSFRNATKNNVNREEISWKSIEEWKRNTAPTLMKEIDTEYPIRNITISNDGTLLAVGCAENITIHASKDFRVKFSRHFWDGSDAIYFNGNDSCIMVSTGSELQVVKIAEELPTMHSVDSSILIRRPWWTENIFLSGNYDRGNDKSTFYMNEFAETNIQYPILMVKGQANLGGIVKTNNCNVLVCKTVKTKLAFKNLPKIDLRKPQSKQQPDHEVDCKGEIEDFIEVSDGNTKKLYLLTRMKDSDYCFLIIDLESFQLKTSTLLVPREFNPRWTNLVSNDKYIASGSYSDCSYVWDIKSGLCIAQLKHENRCVSCAKHPIDPQLFITAGKYDKKIKIWQLNTD